MASPWSAFDNPGEARDTPLDPRLRVESGKSGHSTSANISRQYKRSGDEAYHNGASVHGNGATQSVVAKPKSPGSALIARAKDGSRKLVSRDEAKLRKYAPESVPTDGAIESIVKSSEFLEKLQAALSRYRNALSRWDGNAREKQAVAEIQKLIDTKGPVEADREIHQPPLWQRLSKRGQELIGAYLQACMIMPYDALPEPTEEKQSAVKEMDELEDSLDKHASAVPTPQGTKNVRTVRAMMESGPPSLVLRVEVKR